LLGWKWIQLKSMQPAERNTSGTDQENPKSGPDRSVEISWDDFSPGAWESK